MDTLNIRGRPFHPEWRLYHRPQSAAVKQSLLGARLRSGGHPDAVLGDAIAKPCVAFACVVLRSEGRVWTKTG